MSSYRDLVLGRLRLARVAVQHYREGSLRPEEFAARGEALRRSLGEAVDLLRKEQYWQHAAAYKAARKALRCVAPEMVARYHPEGFADRQHLLEVAEDFTDELAAEIDGAVDRRLVESARHLSLPPGWRYDAGERVLYAANSMAIEGEVAPDRAESEAWAAFGMSQSDYTMVVKGC